MEARIEPPRSQEGNEIFAFLREVLWHAKPPRTPRAERRVKEEERKEPLPCTWSPEPASAGVVY